MGETRMKILYDAKQYSGVKNLLDWSFASLPDIFNPENARFDAYMLADSAMQLSDYQFAQELLIRLTDAANDDLCADAEKKLAECAQRKQKTKKPQIYCKDDLVRGIFQRLSYVFNRIDKPVCVYVPEDEADYNAFYERNFPAAFREKGVHPYAEFMACGFYDDPEYYRVVIKREYVKQEDAQYELTGMCAHEMAHLELTATKMRESIHRCEYHQEENAFINEHFTDLYVMAKGFAYHLYRHRQKYGAGLSVMSATEVLSYLKRLDGKNID